MLRAVVISSRHARMAIRQGFTSCREITTLVELLWEVQLVLTRAS